MRLVRLPNTLSAAADVLAGAALSGAVILSADVLLAAFGSLCIYGGGVALGDVIDRDKDAAHYPDRPLPSGAISPRTATTVAAALLLLGTASGLMGSPTHLLATLGLVAAVLAYGFLSDTTRLAGPVLMGSCRGLNIVRGLTLGAAVSSSSWSAAAGYGLLVLLVTLVSTAEEDSPTAPDARRIRWCAIPIALLWSIPGAVSSEPALTTTLVGAGLLIGAWVVAPLIRKPIDPGRTVFRGVFTLVLFQALLAWSAGSPILALVLAAFLPAMRVAARIIGQRGTWGAGSPSPYSARVAASMSRVS